MPILDEIQIPDFMHDDWFPTWRFGKGVNVDPPFFQRRVQRAELPVEFRPGPSAWDRTGRDDLTASGGCSPDKACILLWGSTCWAAIQAVPQFANRLLVQASEFLCGVLSVDDQQRILGVESKPADLYILFSLSPALVDPFPQGESGPF
jgi:hypothetical protein